MAHAVEDKEDKEEPKYQFMLTYVGGKDKDRRQELLTNFVDAILHQLYNNKKQQKDKHFHIAVRIQLPDNWSYTCIELTIPNYSRISEAAAVVTSKLKKVKVIGYNTDFSFYDTQDECSHINIVHS